MPQFDQIPSRFRQTRRLVGCAEPSNITREHAFPAVEVPHTINSKVVTPYIANLTDKVKNVKEVSQSGQRTPRGV